MMRSPLPPLLYLLLCLLPLAAGAAAEERPLDEIVAVVNDDVITRSELDREIRQILARLEERGTRLPPQSVLERQVLERVVNMRLQLQAAERLGIQVDDGTLARAIGNIAEKNHMSLIELRDTLESEGMSFAQFREDTRRQIILARLRAQEVVNRITVTDQEVQNFLTKETVRLSERSAVHLLHILIAIPEGATPEVSGRAQDKARRIAARLREGADFAETALRYSDGRQALEGGDLGWMKLSEVPTLAQELANTLQRGEVSDPVRSASGFHLFKMADYKGGDRQMVTQTHARHILIKTNELISDQEARTRLEQLRIRLTGGEDFTTLARSHSDDTASAVKGGDLGWLSPGDTVPAFEERMDNLNPGEISVPFRTQFGWHLLQVLERRTRDNTAQALQNKARESIRERKANEATELWLRRLRDEAYVEIRLKEEEPF